MVARLRLRGDGSACAIALYTWASRGETLVSTLEGSVPRRPAAKALRRYVCAPKALRPTPPRKRRREPLITRNRKASEPTRPASQESHNDQKKAPQRGASDEALKASLVYMRSWAILISPRALRASTYSIVAALAIASVIWPRRPSRSALAILERSPSVTLSTATTA